VAEIGKRVGVQKLSKTNSGYIYAAQNADNARTLGMWFDDKLREVYETNFIIVRRWQ